MLRIDHSILRIIFLLLLSLSVEKGFTASLTSVNIDKKTTAAMTAVLAAANLAESQNVDAANEILKNYESAAVASSGIMLKEYEEHKAMCDPTSFFTSSREAFYYRHIFDNAVKIGSLTSKLAPYFVKRPEKIFYWGTYMFSICEETIDLCKIFQSVCTNGKLGFERIRFRELAPDLKKYINPVKMDVNNYVDRFNDLASVQGLEDLDASDIQAALLDVAQAGAGIAGAGWKTTDDVMLNIHPVSRIGKALKMKYTDVMYLYDGFKQARASIESLTNINNIKNTIRNLIVVNGHEVADRIFHIADYNVNSYMADYVRNQTDGYYTQRYYIYSQESGQKVLCDYTPKLASGTNNDPALWPEWTYYASGSFSTATAALNDKHTPSAQDKDNARRKSEGIAGWSRDKVLSYNNTHPGHNATISYTFMTNRRSWRHHHGHYYYRDFYAYSIKVVDSWMKKTEVYDAVFDSRTMDKDIFEEQMKIKLAEYNSDGTGNQYQIGSDAPVPYEAAEPEKLNTASTATFTLDCQSGEKLANSTFAWKENGSQGSKLTAASIDFAMRTDLDDATSGKESIDAVTAAIEQNQAAIKAKQAEIDALTKENQALYKKMQQESLRGDYAQAQADRRIYEANLKKIDALKAQAEELLRKDYELRNAREEIKQDYDDTTDNANRLPSIMKSLESAYQITWKGSGHWDTSDGGCYHYTRIAEYKGLGELKFKADLTVTRRPQWLLGIRIHRAILQVDWELTNDNPRSSIVEVLPLDSTWTPQQKADTVNNHISHWLQGNPNCTINVEYNSVNPDSIGDGDNPAHLLWVSDRLAIASEVDNRLSEILSELSLLLGYYQVKSDLAAFFTNQIMSVLSVDAKSTLTLDCLERWRSSNDSVMARDPSEYKPKSLQDLAAEGTSSP